MLPRTFPLWQWASLVWTLGLVGLPAGAHAGVRGEAGKRLPADTEFIVSVNLRQILDSPLVKKSAPAQRFLEQCRQGLKGDERPLKELFRSAKLKEAGMREEDFLASARQTQARCEAVGLDPFKDLDRVTVGGSFGKGLVTVVEGAFQLAKFRAAAQADVRKNPTSRFVQVSGIDVWEWDEPAQPVSRSFLALLSPTCLVLCSSREAMGEVLERAAGKDKRELPRAMQVLFDEAAGEQIAVVAKVDQAFFQGLAEEMKKQTPPPNDRIGKWAHDLLMKWVEKFGGDVTTASLGLSFGEKDFTYQIGLECKQPRVARGLQSWISSGNLVAGLVLRTVEGDTARMLREIIGKVRLTRKDAIVFIRVPVPYAFARYVFNSPWL